MASGTAEMMVHEMRSPACRPDRKDGAGTGPKAVWPAMLAPGCGRIVLTGSSAGLRGQMQSADYRASKAAMVRLACSVAIDVPPGSDICINVI